MKGLPCFLFGESMGGAVALKAHLKYPDLWDGAVLVAPMCKVCLCVFFLGSRPYGFKDVNFVYRTVAEGMCYFRTVFI
jgi:alpha-beta hydrolase superfamily lysophospholipase